MSHLYKEMHKDWHNTHMLKTEKRLTTHTAHITAGALLVVTLSSVLTCMPCDLNTWVFLECRITLSFTLPAAPNASSPRTNNCNFSTLDSSKKSHKTTRPWGWIRWLSSCTSLTHCVTSGEMSRNKNTSESERWRAAVLSVDMHNNFTKFRDLCWRINISSNHFTYHGADHRVP